jgi:enoyl-[acyl-carrier-protein] reductase (NADH)
MNLLDLPGKKGIVVGIANENSIAYGCAKAFHAVGAELAITYRNAKAEPYVRPPAETLASPIIVPCDVRQPGQLEAVFAVMSNDVTPAHVDEEYAKSDAFQKLIAHGMWGGALIAARRRERAAP